MRIAVVTGAAMGRLMPQVLETLFRVNALGPLLVTQALLPLLRRGARVAHLSSERGSLALTTQGGNYGYRATKAALNSFGRSLAARSGRT